MTADKNTDKSEEARVETPSRADEAIVKTAQDRIEDLVKEGKARTEYLKKGGRSGVSDTFGKPLLVSETSDGTSADVKERGFKLIKSDRPADAGEPVLDSRSGRIWAAQRAFEAQLPHAFNADGWREDRDAANQKHRVQVATDGDGRPTSVTYANGLRADFTYNDQGRICAFKFGTDEWSSADGFNWTVKSQGKEKHVMGAVSLSPDGTMRFASELKTIVTYPDASRLTILDEGQIRSFPDRSSVTTDNTGQVTEACYANGQRLSVVQTDKGDVVVRWDKDEHNLGGMYKMVDRLDKATIDADGTAHISDKTGSYTMKLDGTIEYQVVRDAEGRVTEARYPTGERITLIHGDGEPVVARWKENPDAKGAYTLVGRIEGKVTMSADGTLKVEDKNGVHVTTPDGKTTDRKK